MVTNLMCNILVEMAKHIGRQMSHGLSPKACEFSNACGLAHRSQVSPVNRSQGDGLRR